LLNVDPTQRWNAHRMTEAAERLPAQDPMA